MVKEWGSVENFKKAFEIAGAALFGSGWVFLVARPGNSFRLEILTLPNQDSVLLQPEPAPGLLACDVWEHAYYLKHRQDRGAWLRSWWEAVHWDYIGERLQGVHEGRKQL
jgi:Fe-Mn family superoxide dismutase